MVTNTRLLKIIIDIARIFCNSQSGLCVQGVARRMTENLNNEVFENNFLPSLSFGQWWIQRFTNAASVVRKAGSQWVYSARVERKNLVTGNVDVYNPEHIANSPWQFAQRVFTELGEDIFIGDKNFNESNWGDVRVAYRSADPPYGIYYVPAQVGSPPANLPGGGQQQGSITTEPPIGGPSQPLQTPVDANFLGGLLSNPMLLVGGGILLFFFLMKD